MEKNKERIIGIALLFLILVCLFIPNDRRTVLEPVVDGVRFDGRTVDALVSSGNYTYYSEAFGFVHPQKKVTKESTEHGLKCLIVTAKICKDSGVDISQQEIEDIRALQKRTMEQIIQASQSENADEREMAQNTLDLYYSTVESSGLTLEEYEAIAGEQMIFFERRSKLAEAKFNGDKDKCQEYIEYEMNNYTVTFDRPGK